MSLIEFKNVSKIYKVGDYEQKALNDVNLNIEEGKFVVILGPSGAGKSTLLNLLVDLIHQRVAQFLLKEEIFLI